MSDLPVTADDDTQEQEDDAERPRWISVGEAAERAGIPRRTLYHWIEAGAWPVKVVSLGKHRQRVRLDEFEEWLNSLRADRDE